MTQSARNQLIGTIEAATGVCSRTRRGSAYVAHFSSDYGFNADHTTVFLRSAGPEFVLFTFGSARLIASDRPTLHSGVIWRL